MDFGRSWEKNWFRRVGRPGPGESQMGQGGKKREVVGAEERGGGTQEVGEDQGASLWPVSLETICNMGKIWEAQKKTLEGLTKTARKDFASGRGAAQRSYLGGLKGKGKRKHQHLQFLHSYSYLFSSQHHYSCLQMEDGRHVCLGFCCSAQCLVQLVTQTHQLSETGWGLGRRGLGLRGFNGFGWVLN